MKRYIKASDETVFWDLHDSGYEVGVALEEIIDDLGLTDKFFPEDGEPTADEEDYREVIKAYIGTGEPVEVANLQDIVTNLVSSLNSQPGVKRSNWEDEIDAIRFTLNDGNTYQLVLQHLGKNM